MSKHIKFPSIEQYRNVVRSVIDKTQYIGKDENDNAVFDRNKSLPELTFKGTPKLHGTNSSVVIFPDGTIQVQSRNRILKLNNDNAGFAKFVYDIGEDFWIENFIHLNNTVTVYGEWCGEGIQKGVAISQLPKMFVIFCIRNDYDDKIFWVDTRFWNDYLSIYKWNDKSIYSIDQFESYELDIDFRNPKIHQNELVYITEQVEKECPVGKYFGISSIGKGVVWKCITPQYNDSRFWFKVKGSKHSTSKVKCLAGVDIEKLKTIEEFGDRVVTVNRLMQGIEYLKETGVEPSKKTTGQFLSWFFGDVIKEESDILEESGLSKEDVGKIIGTKAREWYFRYLDNIILN